MTTIARPANLFAEMKMTADERRQRTWDYILGLGALALFVYYLLGTVTAAFTVALFLIPAGIIILLLMVMFRKNSRADWGGTGPEYGIKDPDWGARYRTFSKSLLPCIVITLLLFTSNYFLLKKNDQFFWNASDGSLHYPEWNPLVKATDPIPAQVFSWKGVYSPEPFSLDETTLCEVTVEYHCAAKQTYANAKAIFEGPNMDLQIARVLGKHYLPLIKADAEKLNKKSSISGERIVRLDFSLDEVNKNIVWLEPNMKCKYRIVSNLKL